MYFSDQLTLFFLTGGNLRSPFPEVKVITSVEQAEDRDCQEYQAPLLELAVTCFLRS